MYPVLGRLEDHAGQCVVYRQRDGRGKIVSASGDLGEGGARERWEKKADGGEE